MEDRIYEYWAATIQNGYIGGLIDIVEKSGGPRQLYYMKEDDIKKTLQISDKLATHIANCAKDRDIEREYEYMIQNNISYINYKDDNYPDKLKNIPSKPYGLFVKGCLPKKDSKSVAVIGARECTEYGRLMAEYFGDRLARKEVNIISGMAWGIDGIAQMASVQAGGKSYGVLGCGVDIVYPKKNARLYEMLCENGSGIISEYAPKTTAMAKLFPPRNRLISGLSDIVLVVEARAKSGTFITVDMAIQQGKTVMIVPGRLTDDLSVGCIQLLRDGAIPAISADSVLDELYGTKTINRAIKQENNEEMGGDAKCILECLSLDPISIDEIVTKSGINLADVLMLLTELELSGQIECVGNHNYIKKITISSCS